MHAALGKPVTMTHPPAEAYSAPGVGGLTDGFIGHSADFMNPQWLGIEGKNLEATIDLEKVIDVREVGVHFLQHVQAGIHIPQTLDVLVSDDGKEFRKAATAKRRQDNRAAFTETLTATLEGVKGRFVRVVAYTNGQWLFADEVLVNPERDGVP
jgi:hexosaminidase